MLESNPNPTFTELALYAEEVFPLTQVRALIEDWSDWEEPTDDDLMCVEALNHWDNSEEGSWTMCDALDALENASVDVEIIEMELALL